MRDILTFDNVGMIYYTDTQETIAVKKLTFSVRQGEFVAIIGPSGCGKTTILSLVSQLIKPTEGSITIHSDNPNAVGYMLQRDHLFQWRDIYSNITLGLEIQHKLNGDNLRYVDSLIEKYGLKDFVKHYPSQLSGGMRQRVALIRTLATMPELLLLDEPFSALDYQTRLSVCDDVYSIIKNEHKTALLVTHDISEAISMADKILVLSARPATIVAQHDTNMKDVPTPLLRRKHPTFSQQFDKLYRLLNGEGIANEN